MIVNTRRVGKFVDVSVLVGNTTVELGLHNDVESLDLAAKLREAAEELERHSNEVIAEARRGLHKCRSQVG